MAAGSFGSVQNFVIRKTFYHNISKFKPFALSAPVELESELPPALLVPVELESELLLRQNV